MYVCELHFRPNLPAAAVSSLFTATDASPAVADVTLSTVLTDGVSVAVSVASLASSLSEG